MTTKLDELKALMAAATPGPWAVDPDDRPGMEWNNHIVGADANMTVCFMTHDNTPENVQGFANAGLIVSAINALPELIAAIEALQRSLNWLTSYPGGGTMGKDGPYEQARAALAPFGEDDEQKDTGRA